MPQEKYSQDPKVKLVSIKDFLELSDYLFDAQNHLWKEGEKPDFGVYYKITPSFFIQLNYTLKLINYGQDFSEKLESIFVARRDGKTEFKLFDSKIRKLANEKQKYLRNKIIDNAIKKLEDGKKLISKIPYRKRQEAKHECFKDHLIDIGYATKHEQLKGKYVVFDVETNGTRRASDDLLSISIYDPTTGKGYNRYLPLDLQPLVLTGWINGITDQQLEKETHITQEELDELIDYFDLKHKTLLSFSGGKGTFDSAFVTNYLKRHGLVGFKDYKYENIKSLLPNPGFGCEGQMSKDNLCRLLKIKGVQEIHSGMNDCLLEWKLFERIKLEPLFFINQHLFKYHEGYIIPVSYLNRHPELAEFAHAKVPYIIGKANPIFEFSFPKKILKKIKKFSTNITGISLENGIDSALNVIHQDNLDFLAKNKRNIEYIGSLDSRITEMPVELQNDGSIKSLDSTYDDSIREVNKVTKIVTEYSAPVFEFIKQHIFTNGEIMSQELSISKDGKILALCDLSDTKSVLEIKTFQIIKDDGYISEALARQLYYESCGRNTFALSIDIGTRETLFGRIVTNAVNINIYEIALGVCSTRKTERIRSLTREEIQVLELIKDNPFISNTTISKILSKSPNSIGKIVKCLHLLQYLKKENENKKTSKWIVLRDARDSDTKLVFIDGKISEIYNGQGEQLPLPF